MFDQFFRRGGGLQQVTKRAESRVGKITITGRYHRLPKKLEDDYVVMRDVLGSGYNGQVYKAKSKSSGAMFAVKGFKLHGVTREKKQELESEAEIFLGMDHPHVARLVDVYESADELSLVMECMTGGELFARVAQKKKFDEKDSSDAAWQMLLAVNYIHSHDVVHRDIKLENFLYDSPDSDHLKLIDFGFSKIWKPNTKMALSCGTLAYVAPEVLAQNYTAKCDLWSLGVTVFILLFGYMPFAGCEAVQMQAIREGRYLKKHQAWKNVSEPAQDFVKKLLVVDASKRLSAEQALAHPWIASRDKLAKDTAVMDQEMVDSLINFGQASAFRRAAMSMMAWSLSNEERMSVREAFIELDSDRTGAVSLVEFKQLLIDKFHVDDEQATRAFEALDTCHTDEIHYSEFLAALVSSRIAIHDGLLKDSFKRFDTDNTGFITVANLKEVLGDHFEGQEVEKMLSEADMTHDGQISYSDWIAFLRDGSAGEKHQEVASKIIDSSASSRKSHGLRKRSMDALKALPHEAKQKACCALL